MKPGPKRQYPERDRAIRAAYERGAPLTLIAREHGIHPTRVRVIALRPEHKDCDDS